LFASIFAAAFGQEQLRLRPGESIAIVSSQQPGLCVTGVISPDGWIKLPFAGWVEVAGWTPNEAALRFERALARMGMAATGVKVTRTSQADAPIHFFGAVENSGTYPWRAGLRLAEVLRVATPTPSADLEFVEIVDARGSLLRVRRAPSASGTANDPELRSGDRVFVPMSSGPLVVAVMGEVMRPGNLDFKLGLTVSQALERAGGPKPNGDLAKVEIERQGGIVETINLVKGEDAGLKRGDVVRVPLVSDPAYFYLVGAAWKEGRHGLKPGMTLSQALRTAGGTLSMADLNSVYIARRVGGNLRRTRHSLEEIAGGKSPDPILEPGDLIEIPFRRAIRGRDDS
jgi:protein involved in polysaccharide export with SLBB domain